MKKSYFVNILVETAIGSLFFDKSALNLLCGKRLELFFGIIGKKAEAACTRLVVSLNKIGFALG